MIYEVTNFDPVAMQGRVELKMQGWEPIESADPESAAESYARDCHEGDPTAFTTDTKVWVKAPCGTITKHIVGADWDPSFYASSGEVVMTGSTPELEG